MGAVVVGFTLKGWLERGGWTVSVSRPRLVDRAGRDRRGVDCSRRHAWAAGADAYSAVSAQSDRRDARTCNDGIDLAYNLDLAVNRLPSEP
jgi:hypothetical protein